MKFSGYQSVPEIAEALGVSELWLAEELDEQLGDFQLTLYGQPNYFACELDIWIRYRRQAVLAAQDRFREGIHELVGDPSAIVPV